MLNIIRNLFGTNKTENETHAAHARPSIPKHDSDREHTSRPKIFGQSGQSRQIRWGLVGFNDLPMVYTQPVCHNNPRFAQLLCDLRAKRFQFRRKRDTAAGLAEGLNQVLAQPAKRTAVILITDGNPTSNVDECRAVIESASRERVGIHTIAISETRREILEDLCTEQRLGYGSYIAVQSIGGLRAALVKAVKGIARPCAGSYHRCVFVLDTSFTMNGPLPGAGASKIEAICRVLVDTINDHHSAPRFVAAAA